MERRKTPPPVTSPLLLQLRPTELPGLPPRMQHGSALPAGLGVSLPWWELSEGSRGGRAWELRS